ncbi:hypothetical protein, partial [Burkholderia orbicola]|uniref:hypothetical protein n=1 Tax=Burkholderia orbicola TaxID=2978683 RepID=UPI0039A7186B
LGYALGAIFEQYVSKRVWSQLILLKVRLTVFIHLHLGATVSTSLTARKRAMRWRSVSGDAHRALDVLAARPGRRSAP